MTRLQMSGPALAHYPGIMAELERLHIALDTLRYVDVSMQKQVPRTWEHDNTTKKDVQAVAVLHSGEHIPLTLTELIYDGTATLPAHDGDLGDEKSVYSINNAWDRALDKDVAGVCIHTQYDYVDLTAKQALSLLEWLRQQEDTLKQKVQEN